MKINELFRIKKQPVSFEIFPPKGELPMKDVKTVLDGLQPLCPDFISVTYSAGGGGNSQKTVDIASLVKHVYHIETMAHLTCINSDRAEVKRMAEQLRSEDIDNILALRGDRQEGVVPTDFHYAHELIRFLQDTADGQQEAFCMGAACYPEGHIECEDPQEDIRHLVEKQEAGADFFVSQLFFDNEGFYRFLEKARKAGVTKPISAGVMPILGKSQVSRMIFTCGASLPSDIVRMLYKYENSKEDLIAAGIDYAARQIDRVLRETDCGAHIYTMNRPYIAKSIMEYIGR